MSTGCSDVQLVEGHQCLEFSVSKLRKGASELDAWQLCGGGLQAGKRGQKSYLEYLCSPVLWLASTLHCLPGWLTPNCQLWTVGVGKREVVTRIPRNWTPFSRFWEPNKVTESPRLCKEGSEPCLGRNESKRMLAGRSCVLSLGRPVFLPGPCVPQDGRGVNHTCVLHRGVSPSAEATGQGTGLGPP